MMVLINFIYWLYNFCLNSNGCGEDGGNVTSFIQPFKRIILVLSFWVMNYWISGRPYQDGHIRTAISGRPYQDGHISRFSDGRKENIHKL